MTSLANRKVILSKRPDGIAQAEHFEIVDRTDPAPAAGEVRIEIMFLSVEPAMRGWIADTGNYSEPVALGSVMRALAVGRIVESCADAHSKGDVVMGWFGWQEQAVVPASAIIRTVTETDLSPSLALGVLGINGITAYLAMTEIGRPGPGDTVVVSTAAGSVGSAAGQVAKILGARTIGITGSPRKVAQCLEHFNYDAAIDYKSGHLPRSLADACPDGLNVYYDNTAGEVSDSVYPLLANGARIVVCGTAAIPQWSPWPSGPRIERHLLVKRASMQGFVIFDHMERWHEAVSQLADWIRAGQLRYVEDVLDGIEACPHAIAGLYRGENTGKRIIRLA
ncbi:NADP-dependent oxidoreductase [Hyphomonas sp.]|uniref:NADP-dependent oxidoreductase n=1 Tax=Hyphomonas sp. TaxID=87 RepID=UPI003F710EA0